MRLAPMLMLVGAWMALVGCGGARPADAPAAAAASAAASSPAVATTTTIDVAASMPSAAPAAPNASAVVPGAVFDPQVTEGNAAPVPVPLQPPVLPREAITAADLAVIIAEGDALSEAIGRAYQQARGIPEVNLIRVPVPAGSNVVSASAFAQIKAAIDARLPDTVQATLLTFTQPSQVQGDTCTMGITSAMAFGYDARYCGQCNRTLATAYHDSESTRPWTEFRMRPSMMLGAATLEAAQALMARGLAADGSLPVGTGYLLRTADTARSVRYTDFQGLPAAWSRLPDVALRYVDSSAAGSAQSLAGAGDVLFYFTGLASVARLDSNRFLPGAVADHLTSFGGVLPAGNGQMPATAWLAAGATASYGTVEEPCNYTEKFPKASVLIDHYLRGATVIEAYWKSVAWPGQGLFVGEPLARPWPGAASAVIESGELVVRARALRRNGVYGVEYRADGSNDWRILAMFTAGQPEPMTLRVPLPEAPGGQLRWFGPCPTQPTRSCVTGL